MGKASLPALVAGELHQPLLGTSSGPGAALLATSKGSTFPEGPGRGWGTTPHPTYPCSHFCTMATRALLGLTVTFLPELRPGQRC